MDTKIEIKEEDPLSHDIISHNEGEFFTKIVAMKTNSDAVLVDDGCDMEIKSEAPFPDFCFKKETEFFTKHLKMQIKSETIKCSNTCKLNTKVKIEEQTLVPDFSSQIKGECLQEDSLRKDKKSSSDHEMDNEIEIKEEPLWLETENSSVYNEVKDEDFTSLKSLRSHIEAVSGDSSDKSQFPSTEDMRKHISLYLREHSPAYGHSRYSKSQESYITEKHSVEKTIHSEKPSKCNNGGKICSKASYLKQESVTHEVNKSYNCKTCDKRFNWLSHLKRHNLIHDGTKPYKCVICDNRFTLLSSLKLHNLIHEGKKPHKCEICDKRFTQLSHLKSHNLIHEGKKPYKCAICEKRFTLLSPLKRHNLIHEGKKPHKCSFCEKRFTQFSDLKRHNLIHEGKQPYK